METAELRRRTSVALGTPGATLVLGLVAAVASWGVILATPSSGLDPSWEASLYLAVHRGLLFGTQAIFTYGPLGFLRVPGLWYPGLSLLAYLYSVLLYLALAITLVWSLRGTLPVLLAFLATVILLDACPSIEVPVALVAVWSVNALSPRADRERAVRLLVCAGGVLAGVETLVSLRSGPVIFLLGLITLLAGEQRGRRLATFVLLAAVSFAAGWFAAGQTLGNLGSYVSAETQIISGYSQAMGAGAMSTIRVVGVVLLTLAVVAVGTLGARPGRARGAALIVLLVAGFALYKEAIVREDTGHVQLFLSTLVVIGAGIAFGTRRILAGAAVLVLIAVALAMPRPAGGGVTISPLAHLKLLGDQVGWEISPAQQRDGARFLMAVVDDIDPATLALLRGQRVDVEPWEQTVAWLYDLDWEPLPVFQDYSAYTSRLDQLNARALSSPHGPERILRENISVVDPLSATGDIDTRLPAWDPPAQNLAMLCHFEALRSTRRWEVAGRVPDRCGAAHLLRAYHLSGAHAAALPPPARGTVTFARIDGAGVGGTELVRTLLFRARERFVILDGHRAVRLVPGTAGDGLLMAAAPGIDYPGPFALAPDAHSIAFTGVGGPVTVRLYSLAVRAAAARR